ncbi:Solute carrier family 2 facilitated glucose transporter member 8, partial [Danaus plexippus plexippus]
IRATVLAIIFTYAEILRLVHILTLKKIEELFGVYTLFYIFACINLYGAIYALSVLPNINNKTVRQIERQMKRVPILK